MISMNFCIFWRLNFTKSIIFRAPKFVKIVVLELLDSPKLISRKIWVTDKSWNFSTLCLHIISKIIILKAMKKDGLQIHLKFGLGKKYVWKISKSIYYFYFCPDFLCRETQIIMKIWIRTTLMLGPMRLSNRYPLIV